MTTYNTTGDNITSLTVSADTGSVTVDASIGAVTPQGLELADTPLEIPLKGAGSAFGRVVQRSEGISGGISHSIEGVLGRMRRIYPFTLGPFVSTGGPDTLKVLLAEYFVWFNTRYGNIAEFDTNVPPMQIQTADGVITPTIPQIAATGTDETAIGLVERILGAFSGYKLIVNSAGKAQIAPPPWVVFDVLPPGPMADILPVGQKGWLWLSSADLYTPPPAGYLPLGSASQSASGIASANWYAFISGGIPYLSAGMVTIPLAATIQRVERDLVAGTTTITHIGTATNTINIDFAGTTAYGNAEISVPVGAKTPSIIISAVVTGESIVVQSQFSTTPPATTTNATYHNPYGYADENTDPNLEVSYTFEVRIESISATVRGATSAPAPAISRTNPDDYLETRTETLDTTAIVNICTVSSQPYTESPTTNIHGQTGWYFMGDTTLKPSVPIGYIDGTGETKTIYPVASNDSSKIVIPFAGGVIPVGGYKVHLTAISHASEFYGPFGADPRSTVLNISDVTGEGFWEAVFAGLGVFGSTGDPRLTVRAKITDSGIEITTDQTTATTGTLGYGTWPTPMMAYRAGNFRVWFELFINRIDGDTLQQSGTLSATYREMSDSDVAWSRANYGDVPTSLDLGILGIDDPVLLLKIAESVVKNNCLPLKTVTYDITPPYTDISLHHLNRAYVLPTENGTEEYTLTGYNYSEIVGLDTQKTTIRATFQARKEP